MDVEFALMTRIGSEISDPLILETHPCSEVELSLDGSGNENFYPVLESLKSNF